jgi:NADP-dependent 3-hydroxy acid dehydrogenase YdfG
MSLRRKLNPSLSHAGFAWVTGASSGIGAAVALELAKRGWRVIATARRYAELEQLGFEVKERGFSGSIIPFVADVTDRDSLENVISRVESEHGPVVLAVLNAGTYVPQTARNYDAGAVEKTMNVNVGGVNNALSVLLPRMKERLSGQVAITASVAGFLGLPNAVGYGASKAALINLAECLRFDSPHTGILFQVICPGFVATPLTAKNTFPMPFLITAEEAAKRTVDGLQTTRFEITYPKRFAYILKVLRLLPYSLSFKVLGAGTKW